MSQLSDEKICINCKHRFQGKFNVRCGNLNQENKSLIEYVYWPYSCDLFEQGTPTEDFFIKQGFKKIKGDKSFISPYFIRPEESLTKNKL